jgi:sec-independent protein translocase protein TatC
MTGPRGEMPFLDHLEELRSRILRGLAALAVGIAVGWWVVQRFQLVALLKTPIAPYLPDGKLVVLSPTDPFLIVLKLAFVVGIVLAAPVLLWQVWAFVAPGLYDREKRAILPALFAGSGLFLVGAALGFRFVVPQALAVLFSFQTESLATMITYEKYFGFVLQIVLALGLSFELPLLIVILAVLGVATPARLARFRRAALVLAFIAGAILSPGGDIVTMIVMTLPLVLLYEVGYGCAVVIDRRRRRAAAATAAGLLVALLLAPPAQAQPPVRPARGQPAPAARDTLSDSLRRVRDARQAAVDSARQRRVGLPSGPTRKFAPADSVVEQLLRRAGYEVTRYHADSATFLAADRRLRLSGEALTERGTAILEADRIAYEEASCGLQAEGSPRLFDQQNVLAGVRLHYDTCKRRGVVDSALTSFNEAGTVWFLRGNVAQDSSSSRMFASGSGITSCDLPVAHYHFAAREVKWVSKSVIVARPATLYVQDVPVLWLPFIFQDMRPGRHSGILVPQFGINDIVRPSGGYNRQITNVGYYWAPTDYFDVTGRLDWYSSRYTQLGLRAGYRWLDRFLDGSLEYAVQSQSEGGGSTRVRWNHRQTLDLRTTLSLNLDYATDTRIVNRNAIDPLLNTQQITSQLNFTRRFAWGSVAIGGNRRQSLSDGSITQQFPSVSVSPKPLDFGRRVTWSPTASFAVDQALNTPLSPLFLPAPGGGIDSLIPLQDRTTRSMRIGTPLRIGSFNWSNSVNWVDQSIEGRVTESLRLPDESTPDPTDSITVDRVFTGDFSTALDWQTGLNLPLLFRRSWKLQPVLGVTNVTSGAFALRNRRTAGDWAVQGKRVSLDLNASPTFFGFFGGFGPVQRLRHSISPLVSFRFAPAADIPEEYARAITAPGQPLRLRSDPTRTLSIGLAQNIEAKRRPAPGDTTTDPANLPKFRVLGLTTSALAYDFEQAKQPGRTGWVTPSITNTLQSDLLPGFSLNLSHDLWDGAVGSDTATFDPFLSSLTTSFAFSGATVRRILGAIGLGSGGGAGAGEEDLPTWTGDRGRRRGDTPIFNTDDQMLGRQRQFTANVTYTLARTRNGGTSGFGDRQNLRISTAFSPTPFWAVSWSSQYNVTDSQFESNVLRLERDLHDWRATFDFVRNANGNFSLVFAIALIHLPDVKMDYNQTSFVE